MDTGVRELHSAAPFIDQFQGKTFVIKIGGELLQTPNLLDGLARQILVLWQIGMQPVLVHGAGPQLDEALRRAGHEPRKLHGRRVTDAKTLELAIATFKGTVNAALVSALSRVGVAAIGMSGADGWTLNVRKRPPVEVDGETVDFGFVGDPVSVNDRLLKTIITGDFVPVICSLGADNEGQLYNVNADTVAAEIAVSLGAVKLMFVTDRPGVLHDANDDESVYSVLDIADIERLIKEEVIKGGMKPKVTAAMNALKRGVPRVHIVGAHEEDALLEEVFTNQGCGTMLVASRDGNGGDR